MTQEELWVLTYEYAKNNPFLKSGLDMMKEHGYTIKYENDEYQFIPPNKEES